MLTIFAKSFVLDVWLMFWICLFVKIRAVLSSMVITEVYLWSCKIFLTWFSYLTGLLIRLCILFNHQDKNKIRTFLRLKWVSNISTLRTRLNFLVLIKKRIHFSVLTGIYECTPQELSQFAEYKTNKFSQTYVLLTLSPVELLCFLLSLVLSTDLRTWTNETVFSINITSITPRHIINSAIGYFVCSSFRWLFT